jgi:hypothetical protein
VNWEVCRDNYLSDHKCIQMELTLTQPPPAMVKNWQKTEWPLVTKDLKSSSAAWSPPGGGRVPSWMRKLTTFLTRSSLQSLLTPPHLLHGDTCGETGGGTTTSLPVGLR